MNASSPQPRNLLRDPCSQADLETILTQHPRRPLLPPLDAPAWRAAAANPLVQKMTRSLRVRADAECGEPLPVLTDELYADFARTGVRLNFEKVYFERRRRLARAALQVLLMEDGDPARPRMIASVREKFTTIFEEVSWALPAHVHWDTSDRSGKDPLQIDLFCAETANLMAEMLDLFGAVFPEELQSRVRRRLQATIFDNYLRRDFHWMTVEHNWNAVCHQGVIGAALSQEDDPSRLAELLERMRVHLPFFLKGFGPDGGCSEGPAYWNYGFGWFAVLNVQLETRTGGMLSLFAGDEHVHAIARYGPLMALSGGHVVNFSDGPPSGVMEPSLLRDLAERFEDPACRRAGCEAYARMVEEGIPWDAQRADVFHFSRLVLGCPRDLPTSNALAPEGFLSDLGVLVARHHDACGHLWEFSAKGGHNGEHHNHNDCGSFLLNIDGIRLITEIGAPEYEHDYFGPKRYEFLAARSYGHSVPVVNGREQEAGKEFAARVLARELNADRVIFTLDLTACYPRAARCRRLLRRFVWDKAGGVLRVEDVYELEEPGRFESAVIFEAPGVWTGRVMEIAAGGGALRIVPAAGTVADPLEVCVYRGKRGDERTIHRLRLRPGSESGAGTVACEFRLRPEGGIDRAAGKNPL